MSTDKIKSYLKEYSYLRSLQSLLYWDMETMMPPGAIEDRAARLSYIQGKIHQHITSPKYKRLLDEFGLKRPKTSLERKLLKELIWDYEIGHDLPLKHVKESTHAQAIATHAWQEARSKNDWNSFCPHLDNLIRIKKREASFYKVKRPYDALLRLHDKEFSSSDIDKLFTELKNGLSNIQIPESFRSVNDLPGPFDLDQQKALSHYVAELFGLSREMSRLDVSTHPFSINISPHDQRITTRFASDNLDSLSSTMHEVGHALYEHNLPIEWEGTPLSEAVSLSVHESQSRFWENVVGRSREFCELIYPQMHSRFSSNLKGFSSKDLFLAMNKSTPGPIRVESSEFYYNFHVIIRYEIEEMIFNQGLATKDLPSVWSQKYQDYLGITPSTDREGILQDSHWAGGAFGYFPTYTLGNLITGSLWKQTPKLKEKIANGDFKSILEYLKNTIHSKGRSTSAKEIVGEVNVQDYLSYLKNKFKT